MVSMQQLIHTLTLNPGASEEMIQKTEHHLECVFPDDYRTFIRLSNGAEGSIGRDGYIALWSLDEVIELNELCNVKKFAPGLILFGGDGGGEAFAFDARYGSMPIVQVAYVGMSLDPNELIALAPTFLTFLQQQYDQR